MCTQLHTHTCHMCNICSLQYIMQVAQVQEWLDEKALPVQVAEDEQCASGLSLLVAAGKHHQCKLQLVTTTTCASGMDAPFERRETPQAQGAKDRTQGAKGRTSISTSWYGMQHNMQLQPPPLPTRYRCSNSAWSSIIILIRT